MSSDFSRIAIRHVAFLVAAVSIQLPLFGDDASGEVGFKAIFDGETLKGWHCDESFWSVQEGAIVAESTDASPCNHNSFLQWTLGQVDDFDLRLKVRISGTEKANSGIQFRSQVQDDGHVVGYQADLDRSMRFAGMLYDEHGRGILCPAGQTVVVDGDSPRVPPQAALPSEEAKSAFNLDGWNDYRILAQGNRIQLFLNGVKTVDLTDNDTKNRDFAGVLALQLHSGPPMKAEFKDIRLKRLPLEHAKKVVFLGGKQSHGYGKHEFNAGSKLLADALALGVEGVQVSVYVNGWPKDPTWLDNIDCLVVGADGQGRHPLLQGLDAMQTAIDRGMGLVCWHYAVEATPDSYDQFRSWLGGGFEVNYSVNPHFDVSFDEYPEHPITRGLPPFAANDEWYYHMRFVPGMEGVTPILSVLPPRESLSRPDGHHSNNPYVREAVLEKKEPQHIAWAYERPNGGRSFGFTGGHNHSNWGIDGFRNVVLNAVTWTAGLEVPSLGVPSSTPSEADLDANIDPGQKGSPKKSTPAMSDLPKIVSSEVIDASTKGHRGSLEASVKGATRVSLVVTDGGNTISCDWANWIDPVLVGPSDETPLTTLKWSHASSDWGKCSVNKNASGGEMVVGGKSVAGIGAHSASVITFDLPDGHDFATLKTDVGLDRGGIRQSKDAAAQFHIVVDVAGPDALALADGKAVVEVSDIRAPESAVSNLDVGHELETTLFASEPLMYSPSNIDVDHLGRVWVCEVVNYRRFRNTDWPEREEGDRILVLEDTNNDGVADKKTTFYQGRDIDSPHGVCVLGDRVIVSAGEHVFSLFDDDGDLKADRKEVMFSGIDGVQHDHGIHSFLFGPDGKLYFNFGNAGKRLKDKDGNIVVDKQGNRIDQDQGPYFQGMVFRCDLDGSNVETLGWNFRNNWEVAVDSFGSMWQSDNDDDGNRGTRINYVLEYGNYGYQDEITKAGWREPRTGMHEEIPKRHWHLNDPGVVPNVIQTGAGSPTGIMVYEGKSLPSLYQNEVIHCDAGPNQVRAFPVTAEGAGYSAKLEPVLTGTRDQWFRPSDVTAAPDGSLIVADWYDPGVGGHRMQDVNRGRLFRVASPGNQWSVPKFDFTTAAGAIEALKSPNLEARYLAFQALHQMRQEAASALQQMASDSDSRMAARAIYCLGKMSAEHGSLMVRHAKNSEDPMLRIVALRLARQLDSRLALAVMQTLAADKSPIVRREVCVALVEQPTEIVVQVWPALVKQYDGEDRWMLEALGIAARGRWDECLAAYQQSIAVPVNFEQGAKADARPSDAVWRTLVWRSRASNTPELLVEVIRDASTPSSDLPKLMRAFDFQPESASKNEVLADLAFGAELSTEEATTFVRGEAIGRLKDFKLQDRPEYLAKLNEIVDASYGTAQFVTIVSKFGLTGRFDDVVRMATEQNGTQNGADAITMLANWKDVGQAALRRGMKDDARAAKLMESVKLAGASRTTPVLLEVMENEDRPLSLRRQAVEALSRSGWGAEELVKRAESNSIDSGLMQSAIGAMQSVNYGHLGDRIAKAFPSPAGKDARPIPTIRDLVAKQGSVKMGRVVFNTNGTCAKCHVVNGIGKEVGPALDEIGSKLSREAMFVSVLYPSAGVSHNYETFTAVTIDGDVVTGLMQSETEDEVVLKTAEGLLKKIPRDDIEFIEKQEVSLMPADLQKVMTNQEIIDLVDYMQTLKKKQK